jgi:hypothetical protein
LLQEVDDDRREEMEAKIKKFISETKWRRLKSRFKIDTAQIEESTEDSRGEFVSVEEAIRQKNTRYRVCFKQRKKILTQSVDSSPLVQLTSFYDGPADHESPDCISASG